MSAMATLAAMADAQGDLNRHLKSYNQQIAARQYVPAAREAAAAAEICIEAKNYEGAASLLRSLESAMTRGGISSDTLPAAHFALAKARFALASRVSDQAGASRALARMESAASASKDKALISQALFDAAQHYYATGQTAKGDLCIAHLIRQYDSGNDYKGATQAYRNIIARAVSAGDASLVQHTYENYMRWNDSIRGIQARSEVAQVQQEYDQSLDTIESKDSAIRTRTSLIVIFAALFAVALGLLAVGAVMYMRISVKNRRMRRSVEEADARSEAKSAMLRNMSSQLEPSLAQLPADNPGVQTIKDYMRRVGELSAVDSLPGTPSAAAATDVSLEELARRLDADVRPHLPQHAQLSFQGMKGTVKADPSELEAILSRLLDNAAANTPMGGKISLTYRKRGVNTHQFVVTDSGPGIPKEQRETVFKAFAAIHDLATEGDGLSLPICALRAEKMGGSLQLNPDTPSASSFVLTLK